MKLKFRVSIQKSCSKPAREMTRFFFLRFFNRNLHMFRWFSLDVLNAKMDSMTIENWILTVIGMFWFSLITVFVNFIAPPPSKWNGRVPDALPKKFFAGDPSRKSSGRVKEVSFRGGRGNKVDKYGNSHPIDMIIFKSLFWKVLKINLWWRGSSTKKYYKY